MASPFCVPQNHISTTNVFRMWSLCKRFSWKHLCSYHHYTTMLLSVVARSPLLALPIELFSLVSYFCLPWHVWWSGKTQRQSFTSVSTHIITAGSGRQEHGLSFPGVLHCDCSFTQTPCKGEACSSLCQSYSSSTCPVFGWVSRYETGYKRGAAWLVSTHLGPAFLPYSPPHSCAWQKNLNLWPVTSGSGELKLTVCVNCIRYLYCKWPL